jgi:hypothetical protein
MQNSDNHIIWRAAQASAASRLTMAVRSLGAHDIHVGLGT